MWVHRMELIIDYIRQSRLALLRLVEALRYKLESCVCFSR